MEVGHSPFYFQILGYTSILMCFRHTLFCQFLLVCKSNISVCKSLLLRHYWLSFMLGLWVRDN